MTKLNTTELLQHVTDLFDTYGVPYEIQKNTGLLASHTNPTEILSDLIDIYPVIFVSSILRQAFFFIMEAFIYQYRDFRYYAAIKKEKLKASQEQIN